MGQVHYLTGQESAISIIWATALGEPGSIRWRGCPHGLLFSPQGEVIGSYHAYVSGGGWSIHTKPYGGFAHYEELDVTAPCTCDVAA